MHETTSLVDDSLNGQDKAGQYRTLSEGARDVGLPDLAERLSAYAHELETNEKVRADDFVAKTVEEAKTRVQELLHAGEPGRRSFLYTGIEGGPISEETLLRLRTALGVPELRTRQPDATAGTGHGFETDHPAERIYRHDTGEGLELELTVTDMGDGGRIFTLDALKR